MVNKLASIRNALMRSLIDRLSQDSAPLLDTDPTLDPKLVRLCREAASEGIVLLCNDGTLPLRKPQRVAVFGRVQIDYFVVGYGSGGDVKAPYRRNLLEALRESPIEVDEELSGIYSTWCTQNRPDEGYWGHWPMNFPEMPLPEGVVESAASRASTAIVVIGRAAGEDRENKLQKGSYYLTDDERAMLASVSTNFEHTVVVMDCGNIMDLAWIEDYDISAVLMAWQGGMEAANAVSDVLCGKANPSGKLTATVARRYEDYPSAGNFEHRRFNEYAEDVFVGYRYFETFAPETVLFPFGHGLSYSSFDLAVTAASAGGEIKVDALVTNSGVLPGKEVVQVYFRAPDGDLAKPARQLAAYAKTSLLAPGQSETLAISFPITQMASYDDAGITGHQSAYVLEPGSYDIFAGTDVRSAAKVGTHTVVVPVVTEQLTEACAPDPKHPFRRMTLERGADGTANVTWASVTTATTNRVARIHARRPPALPSIGDRGHRLEDVARGKATLDEFISQLTPTELEALSRGDVIMGSPLGAPGNAGVFGGILPSLREKGVPPVTATDGPSGIRLAAYTSLLPCGTALASSWNVSLLTQLSARHGLEMIAKGSDVLLSPGMNIQRDPLCGRNFEYFSEDPLLTGKTAAAVVSGIQSAGVSACPKHFACNNQETNRNRHDSRVSERALREIYLKGFEICVKEAQPHTLMTAYNKINGVWAHYNDDLATSILRDEWGYEGAVITDWWMQRAKDPDFPDVTDNAYRVRAQVDVLMPGSMGGMKRDKTDNSLLDSLAKPSGITLGELQRGARNVLTFVMKSHPFRVALGESTISSADV